VDAKPSWASVLAATFRLWLQRRGRPGRRGWQVPGLAAVILVVLAAAVLTYVVSRDGQAHPAGQPAAPANASPPAAVVAANAVRRRAAQWVTQQVNRDAIVACDPAMCGMLHSSHFPAANLLPILPATSDPLGADLVMATAVVRSHFGARLAGVYAPQVIARFGTGTDEVDVRVVPPAGAAGSRARLAQARQAARQQGQELLTNQRLQASGQARTALTEGRVDSRLLAVLPVLANGDAVNIIDFGDANPGAPRLVPLRSADLAAADPDHARTARGYRHFLMSLLRAQDRSLYRAASITIARAAGLKVVRIEFAAPSP
jgi:hypothetical protein